MEKKKTKKTSSKSIKKKTSITKKTSLKSSVKNKTSKKKGFTLIELLAVIIILGILMIIAIPSVTKYISDSRKSAYVNTAKEIIGGTRNIVNEGKLGMYDTDATYYIPAKYVSTENSLKSPYGEFTDTSAYVGVTYDGQGYKYYWISTDDAGQGISDITLEDDLDTDKIESDLTENDITGVIETTGIGNRNKIYILDTNTETWNEVVGGAVNHANERYIPPNIVCIPATTLHSKTCNASDSGCDVIVGYGNNITYGTIPDGTPKAGDAYDCKVKENGTYSERFYYVGSSGENSILIYYDNMNDQTPYVYDSSDENWHGPRTAYQYLPSTTEWNNPRLIAPGTREIVAENGATSTSGGTIENFTYTNKAARFLTVQEVKSACNVTYITNYGELDGCYWLLENIGWFEEDSGLYAYWLESPYHTKVNVAFGVAGWSRRIINYHLDEQVGVRPTITIKTNDILE